MSAFLYSQAGKLQMPQGRKLVLMAICDDASEETRIAFPGAEKLAIWGVVNDRSVKRLTEELHQEGLIYRLGGGYAGRRREYLVFPTPAEIVALDDLAQSSPSLPIRLVVKTLKAVDNSQIGVIPGQKKGVASNTKISGKGVISGRKGVTGNTPPVITPLTDLYGSSVMSTHHSAPVDNSTDDRSTHTTNPKPHPPIPSHELDVAAVRAAAGYVLDPTGISDELLIQLGHLIVGKSSVAVIYRTQFVIKALTSHTAFEWQQVAFDLVAQHDPSRTRELATTEGNPF